MLLNKRKLIARNGFYVKIQVIFCDFQFETLILFKNNLFLLRPFKNFTIFVII